MKASTIWSQTLNADFGPLSSSVRIHGEIDLGRIGIFAVEVVSFNTYKSKTVRSYQIEAYEYDVNGELRDIDYQGFSTKADLIKAFKTYSIPEHRKAG